MQFDAVGNRLKPMVLLQQFRMNQSKYFRIMLAVHWHTILSTCSELHEELPVSFVCVLQNMIVVLGMSEFPHLLGNFVSQYT